MSWGSRVVRTVIALVLVGGGVATPLAGGVGVVHAVPTVTISNTMAAQTLIGSTTSASARVGNSGDTTAFNLMLVLRLPLGVHLASSEIPPSETIVETDAGGTPTGTVVSFENVVDIVPGGAYNFGYSLSHDVGTDPDEWDVFDTYTVTMEAHVSDSEAIEPNTTAEITGSETTAVITNSFQNAAADASTELVPLLLSKSEPSPESELLRGVHDHQTVYTVTAETGAAAGVGITVVDDYIPAGIEFLGCGDDDNSSSEEYPGSGPINPGNAPFLAPGTCLDPVLVETVANPPGLPGGVYTHVQWDVTQTLPINSVISRSYVAAIPMRENTLTWPAGEPAAASLEQGSNLDNNTGPLTTQNGEGNSYTNYVSIGATYGGSSGDVSAQATVQAVDLAVHKYVDRAEINQGEISTWTLQLQTSEYVVDDGVSGLALIDVTPDGTCPIGSDHPGCPGTTEPAAEPPYTTTAYEADGPGTTTLEWDLLSQALGPNEEFYVTFSTLALGVYDNGTPISTNDQWTNDVDMSANVTTFVEEGPDGIHEPGRDVTDSSSAAQAGSQVSIEKDVARPPDGQTCGNGAGLDWQPESVESTGPGDRVCFRITATPPDFLDTIEATLSDFLPIGFEYEDGSSTPGQGNEIPTDILDDVQAFGDPSSGMRVDWTLKPTEFVEPAQVSQVVFGALLVGVDGNMPDLADSGDVLTNEARYQYQNTSGEIFVDFDDADVVYNEARLDLTKGIGNVDGTDYDPAIDTALDVEGGQTVTYEIVVSNAGTADATDVVVLDTLPINNDGITDDDGVCGDISAISSGGSCSVDDVTWTGLTVPAGGSITLEYTWTLPAGVSASTSWDNNAGVVEYHTSTNNGADFTYVPRDNIDPSREPDANTESADDDAHIFSPGISLTKTRTTSIAESGNSLAGQATIGEVITYTVEYRQSANTTVTDPSLIDTLPATLDLDETSVAVASFDTAPGAACPAGTPTPAPPFDATDNVITVDGIGDVVAPADADRCSILTFDATVLDDGGPVRPDTVRNTVTVAFSVGGQPRQVSASVDTSIVEPNLSIDKRSGSAGAVLPGSQIPYTLVVTNASDTQVSPAHDLVVVDTLPAQIVDVTDLSPAGGIYDGGAGTVTWTLDPSYDLDPGESLTLSYTATLASPLVATSTMTNTAAVTATAITGVDAGERTAASTCSPGGCPGYIDDDSLTLTVGGPILSKTVVTPNQTFGHTVDYRLILAFPANLDFGPTTLTDDLAGGDLKFLETVNSVCVGCSDADRAQYVPAPNGLTTTPPLWSFGDIGPADVTRRVIITYRAVVVDDAALGAGDTITNTATLDWETGSLTDDAVIDLAEPDVTLAKRVESTYEPGLTDTDAANPVQAQAGDTLSYDLTITNQGSWTAYDVLVEDVPDTVGSTDCSGTSRVTNPVVATDPAWTVTDDSLVDDACLRWTVPSLLPGQSVVLTYSVVVPEDFDEFIDGDEFVNLASIPEYWALTASERAISPDDVRVYPPTPVTDEGFVDINHSLLGDFVWFDIDADGVQDAGEPGIPGVTVTVDGPGGQTMYTTDDDGLWRTYDGTSLPPTWLAPGDYTITVDTSTLPDGLDTNTFATDGTLDNVTTVSLAENEENLDQDFGYTGTGSIGDQVWLDFDVAGGTFDPGERGLANVAVTVVWLGFDGTPGGGDDVAYPTVTTDADGLYLVDQLPAGEYTVSVDPDTVPLGVVQTYDLDDADWQNIQTPDSAALTLGDGEDRRDADFAYKGESDVGNLVWLDFDADGDGPDTPGPGTDADEPGINGVTVTVTWAGVDGTLGTADDIVFPTVTTAADTPGDDGRWRVFRLPAGDISVVVDDTTLPAGVSPSYDLDGIATPHTATLALGVGVSNLDVDFGYAGTGSLGDRVWLDVNGDGAQDVGEPGLTGVEVTATAGGVTFPTVTTGVDGIYTIPNLPAGDFTVTVDISTLPSGVAASYDLDGGNDSIAIRTLTDGETATDVDFGYVGSASIGDTLWVDLDQDDVADPDEPGIPGATVTVTWFGPDGATGGGDDVEFTTTTDASGEYLVAGLPAGAYRVEVDESTLPSPLLATYDLDGGDDSTAERDLAVGEQAADVDFGYLGESQVGDLVWWDVDGNGVQDAGEPALPGVTVTLVWAGFDGVFGTTDDSTQTTVTDDDADAGFDNYGFDGLPSGEYRVSVDTATLPPGFENTADPDGGADSVSELSLAVGDEDLDQDFGYTGTGSIGDFVWLDLNGDGVQDAGEPGIAGVDVDVIWAGPNGTFGDADDFSLPVPTTAADGSYTVGNLPSGNFRVSVETATLPVVLTETYELDGTLDASSDVELTVAAPDRDDVDFGFAGTATVGDTVWLDRIDDDIREPLTEPGIPNITMTATWGGFDGVIGGGDDLVFATTTTDADGQYLFEHLPPGEVQVTVGDANLLAAGLVRTFDPDATLDATTVRLLAVGATDLLADFGYNGANTVGDLVWYDIDADGIGPDSAVPDTEPGIPGQVVNVRWAGVDDTFDNADDLVFVPTVTDADGRWSIDGLPDGLVRVTLTGGPATELDVTYNRVGETDGALDLVSEFDITATDLDFDFGLTGAGSIGDALWLDVNANASQDGFEPGIPGVTVGLQWAGWNGVFDDADDVIYDDVATDASGLYGFAQLPAGDFRVVVQTATLPVVLTETYELDGTLDATTNVELTVAAPDRDDVDFGFAGNATVGDTVWLNRNDDGDRDPLIEPGIPNITVTATWGGYDGVIGGGDDLVLPTSTTDADGQYLFENLPPGEVQITVDDANLLAAGLTQNFNPDDPPGPDPDGANTSVRTLAFGASDLDADFGYDGANQVGDRVWYDIDADGVDDAGEPGIPDQTVVVRWAGPDATFDNADDLLYVPVTTDADGLWSVDGLPDGPVRVTLVGAPAAELEVTYNRPDETSVALDLVAEFSITGDDLDFDVGLTGTAEIGDRVWLDFDADGTQDAVEPGLVGVDVTIRWAGWDGVFQLLPGPGNDDVVHPTVTTTATGLYELVDLPPGTYRVTVDDTTLPDGVEPSFDLDGVATANVAQRSLAVGQIGRNVDFGYTGTAELGDFVWWDVDGDGVQDAGEPGLPGVSVAAVWSGVDGTLGTLDDKVVPPTATNASGRYEFTGLPAGDFRVTVVAASLPAGMTASFDLDGGDDSTALRSIAVGATANNVDFGYVGQFTVGDLVWDDVDLDTVREAGEPAIAGAEVTLQFLGADGTVGGGDDVFITAITADPPQIVPSGRISQLAVPNPGDPYYEVPGLVPGRYVVTLDASTLPPGVTPVSDLDGGDPVTTTVDLASDDLDVDFVVFENIAPVPPQPGASAQVACGSTVDVDPLAGVTDENGDDLSLVPGSVVAPSDVTVEELPNGDLQIVTTPDVADGAQVRWTVQDEHGGTTAVTLTLDVNCIDASANLVCSPTGAQSLSYMITGVGQPASPPATITWFGPDGGQLSVATNQPLSGQIAWPAAVPRSGTTVSFTTSDGAATDRIDPGASCQDLPQTGADSQAPVGLAIALLVAGILLVGIVRRRRTTDL